MKTCYGGYCVDNKRGRELSTIGPSAFKTFLVVVAIVTTLFVVGDVLSEVSIGSYLSSLDWNSNSINLDYLMSIGF